MDAIRASGVKIGIDPLGGASVHFWRPIIERYGIAATIVNDTVDPTFRFMTADWDGKIRMDCSSPYAMARLIGMREQIRRRLRQRHRRRPARHRDPLERADEPQSLPRDRDRVFVRQSSRLACRRRSRQNHRQQRHHRSRRRAGRPRRWSRCRSGSNGSSMGCSTARSALAARRAPARRFCSATARFGRRIRTGFIPGLLAAEITARTGRDPGEVFDGLTSELGVPFYAANRRAGDIGAEDCAEEASRRSNSG